MKLDLNNELIIDNISTQELETALFTLRGSKNSFAILSHDNGSFIQTATSGDYYVVEYLIDTKQFKSVREDFSFNEVVELFRSFHAQEDYWQNSVKWEPLEEYAIVKPIKIPHIICKLVKKVLLVINLIIIAIILFVILVAFFNRPILNSQYNTI